MTIQSIRSYDLGPKVFTRESMFNIADMLAQRAQQLVTAEETARTNADQAIIMRFTTDIGALTSELAQVRVLAETLGGTELAQIEDSLLKVLNQPAFAELLSGGSLEGFKLSSIVKAIASQPDVASFQRSARVDGVETQITMVMTDGRQATFSASITEVAADDAAGTPERRLYRYVSPDFLGLPAQQDVLFNVFRLPGIQGPFLEEFRTDLVLFDIGASFVVAGPAPVLATPDLNADGTIGIPAPVNNGAGA